MLGLRIGRFLNPALSDSDSAPIHKPRLQHNLRMGYSHLMAACPCFAPVWTGADAFCSTISWKLSRSFSMLEKSSATELECSEYYRSLGRLTRVRYVPDPNVH